MLVLLVLLFVFLTLDVVRAQDPAKTDSDKYKVVLENGRVRVLEYPTNREQNHNACAPGFSRCSAPVLLNGN
jgi:hypothetical protein